MERFYRHMLMFIHNRKNLEKTILIIVHYFPYVSFIIYPYVLLDLWITGHPLFIQAIIRPLCAFTIVTIFRKIVNRPRPYETMNIVPLVSHKQGESFPSRHTVSAFIIALVCFYSNYYLGIIILIVACIMSFCRVLAGVHYISDVIASIFIAIFIYFI